MAEEEVNRIEKMAIEMGQRCVFEKPGVSYYSPRAVPIMVSKGTYDKTLPTANTCDTCCRTCERRHSPSTFQQATRGGMALRRREERECVMLVKERTVCARLESCTVIHVYPPTVQSTSEAVPDRGLEGEKKRMAADRSA
jgi:hypothetical protein